MTMIVSKPSSKVVEVLSECNNQRRPKNVFSWIVSTFMKSFLALFVKLNILAESIKNFIEKTECLLKI